MCCAGSVQCADSKHSHGRVHVQDSSEGLFADLFARGSFGTAPSCRPLRSAPAAAGPHPSPQDSWTKDAAMRSAPSDSLVRDQL